MPYSGANDDNLPEHIQKLSETKRAGWVKAWNAAYAGCQEKGGDDCEGYAFRVAHGAVKRIDDSQEGNLESTDFLLIELEEAALVSGRAFDGLVAGEFTDMLGRRISIDAASLPAFVENTQRMIESARTESGELVGLPIDARGHDKGDGAGWIVGVELAGNVLRFVPRWTEVGLDLIRKGIRRFFSATVDLAGRAVLGGTLTNWPAVRAKDGRYLLRPVELENKEVIVGGRTMMTLAELSDEVRAQLIEEAKKTVDLSALYGEQLHQMEEMFRDEAEKRFGEFKAAFERDRHVAEFCATMETKGLPAGERLTRILVALPDAARGELEAMLGEIASKGPVEFSEAGHSKEVKGGRALPDYVVRDLDSGEVKLAELSNPIFGLGDLSQYDLSKWK